MIDLIPQTQINAKIIDERSRMRNAAIAIDFYNGQQYYHMKDIVEKIYPDTWKDIIYYIACSDMTKGVINKKATLFSKAPEIEINTKNEKLQKAFEEMLNTAKFWKKLIAADRMAELTGKVGLSCHWHDRDKRVVVDVITPDKCIVITDPQDPTQPIAVYYAIATDNDIHLASPINVYAKWTAESYSEVELNYNFVETKIVKPAIPNPYGRIPVIWLSPEIEVDTFWIDLGYPLIEANINVNLRESNLDLALDYQSFSTLITVGHNNPGTTITGVTRRLDFKPDELSKIPPSAYYITPDAKLAEVAGIIQNKKIAAAQESGVSADAFNQNASNITSGYQLRLTKADIEDNNELKKEIYRPELIQLIKFMCQCYSAHSSSLVFPGELDIYFNYMAKPGINNPIETTQLQLLKINAGLMSLADAIRENNPGLSQEDAIEEAKRIKKEQSEIRGLVNPITDADLGIEA